jgi:hypothetical protein
VHPARFDHPAAAQDDDAIGHLEELRRVCGKRDHGASPELANEPSHEGDARAIEVGVGLV